MHAKLNLINERIVVHPQLYNLGINTHFIFALLCAFKKLITRYLLVFRIKTATNEVLHIIREKRVQRNTECWPVSCYLQTVKSTRHAQQFVRDIASIGFWRMTNKTFDYATDMKAVCYQWFTYFEARMQ